MDIARLIPPAISAFIATLTLLVTIPFGPVQRASRKLRQLRETIDAMDEQRHTAQRAVLLRQTDALTDKIAALHRIPTPWVDYLFGTAILAALAGALLSGLRYGFSLEGFPSGHPVLDILFWTCAGMWGAQMGLESTLLTYRQCRYARARFVQLGFPEEFTTRCEDEIVHFVLAAEQGKRRKAQRRRALDRAKRMRHHGTLPADWHRYWAPRRTAVRVWHGLAGAPGWRWRYSSWRTRL